MCNPLFIFLSLFLFLSLSGKGNAENALLSNRRAGEVVERPSFPGVGGWEKARQITPGLIRQCAINFGLHADSYYFIYLLLPQSPSPLTSDPIVMRFQPPAASLCLRPRAQWTMSKSKMENLIYAYRHSQISCLIEFYMCINFNLKFHSI